MIAQYIALSQRLREELEELEKTVTVIPQHLLQAEELPVYREAFFNSVALNLHAFYAGLERMLEMIAVEVDGRVLGGKAWHTELLRQMAIELPGVRPVVLRRETMTALDEYRKFRHLIRNIYATRLDQTRITQLVQQLPATWREVKTDLTRFQAFLRELARADEDES